MRARVGGRWYAKKKQHQRDMRIRVGRLRSGVSDVLTWCQRTSEKTKTKKTHEVQRSWELRPRGGGGLFIYHTRISFVAGRAHCLVAMNIIYTYTLLFIYLYLFIIIIYIYFFIILFFFIYLYQTKKFIGRKFNAIILFIHPRQKKIPLRLILHH